MRQFILCEKNLYSSEYGNGDTLDVINPGELTVINVGMNASIDPTMNTAFQYPKGEYNIILKRDAANGGNIVVPIHTNNFSYTKGVYAAASRFVGKIIIPNPTAIGDYSVIVALKGAKFNERNKWTATVRIDDFDVSAFDLATKLAAQINNNSENSGVTATVQQSNVVITASKTGVDYNIIGADELFGADVEITSNGIPGYGDVKYIQDLAEKASADAGFEYTYKDANQYMYPGANLGAITNIDPEGVGFTIFTLRFAEPRNVKTHDELVNQIVQVAFKNISGDGSSKFEYVLKRLM